MAQQAGRYKGELKRTPSRSRVSAHMHTCTPAPRKKTSWQLRPLHPKPSASLLNPTPLVGKPFPVPGKGALGQLVLLLCTWGLPHLPPPPQSACPCLLPSPTPAFILNRHSTLLFQFARGENHVYSWGESPSCRNRRLGATGEETRADSMQVSGSGHLEKEWPLYGPKR